jgi:heme/copper-type cytochrome/quinol oxidase subunit 4
MVNKKEDEQTDNMTEIGMADLRKAFVIALLLTVIQQIVTSGGDIRAIIPTLGGFIVFFAALFVVGLLFLHLQRQSAW